MLSPSAPENRTPRMDAVCKDVGGRADRKTGLGGVLRGCRFGTPGVGVCAVVLNQHNRCSFERWSRFGTTGPSLTIRPVVSQTLGLSPGVSNQHPRAACRVPACCRDRWLGFSNAACSVIELREHI